MIWIDLDLLDWGLCGHGGYSPAVANLPGAWHFELWIGPVVISGRWETQREAAGWRENKRR